MKLKTFTLRWEPDGRFDTESFDRFVEDHDVLAVTEHFFVHEGLPWWSLLVSHRPRDPRDRSPVLTSARARSAHEPPELAADDRLVFDALRQWRNDRARLDGKPPYVLFTNNQMVTIARLRPKTLAALSEIHGIGEAKCQAWGAEMLALLASLEPAKPMSTNPAAEPTHVG